MVMLSRYLDSFFPGNECLIIFKVTITFLIALCIFTVNIFLFFVVFFSETDESCKKHLGRVLSIWEERSVYENDVLEQLKQALCKCRILVSYLDLFIKTYSSLKLKCSFISDGDKKPRKRTYEQIKVDENENCSSLGSPSEPPQVEVLPC